MPAADVQVRNLQTYTLIAAVANVVISLGGTIAVLFAGVGTCGLGCIFIFLPILNLASAIVDFIAYSKLDQPPTPAVYSSAKSSAIFDLVAGLAIVPLIMGILKLQILGDEAVQRHFGVTP